MVAVPILFVTSDSLQAIDGARALSMQSAPARNAPPPARDIAATLEQQTGLKTLRLDTQYAPVPTSVPAAAQVMTMSPRPNKVGPTAFAVRGTIDDSEIAQAQKVIDDDGNPQIFADPQIGLFQTCIGDPAVGDTIDVRKLLGVGRLRNLSMDGSRTAIAIVDNGINLGALRAKGLHPTLDVAASWSPRTGVVPGAAPIDHGTMCAYDALIAAPQATLLDYSVLLSTRTGGSRVSGLLSDAVIAYGKLLMLMALSPDERHFHSLVVNNSWGMYSWSWDFPPGHTGRYGDNAAHPFNRQVATLSASGADILFAAGNCGPVCPDGRCDRPPVLPVINGANSHPDVITVAGVDINRSLVGYSSHGPGALANDKPDIAAYTHFLGSEAFGIGDPDSGTSAACPVLAGVIAALRSQYGFDPALPQRSPSNIKQFLLSCAVQPAGPAGWRNDLGHGIVDTTGFGAATAIA
jgi:subtilisin family serine protease